MSVYNGEAALDRTVTSVLRQEDCDFELVIVDDGSTDRTTDILRSFAELDDRVRVLSQPNQGLTRALIRGCREARGRYIARQDCGDESLPGRLAAQQSLLDANPEAVICVSGVQPLANGRVVLPPIIPTGDSAQLTALLRDRTLGIPAHGCVMMRRDAYIACGGYREDFYYAQDCDLWLRLAERGELVGTPEELYVLSVDVGGISTSRTMLQTSFADLARIAYGCRQRGESDGPVLARVRQLAVRARSGALGRGSRYELAGAHYRLGTMLEEIDMAAAREHFIRALRMCPYYWRAWLRIL